MSVRDEIKDLAPEAKVGVFEGDVCDVGDVERVVREVVGDGTDAGLGRRLDIVVACAGKVDLYNRRTSIFFFLSMKQIFQMTR